jgi:hypothetical protein
MNMFGVAEMKESKTREAEEVEKEEEKGESKVGGWRDIDFEDVSRHHRVCMR